MYSRREFGKLALVSLPLSTVWGANTDSSVNGVKVGAATFSFRDLPHTPGHDNVARVIQALRTPGISEIELNSADTESPAPISGIPKPQAGDSYGAMNAKLTPAELAIARKATRDNLRRWRLSTPASSYEAFRAKFDAARISLFSYRVDYDDQFTDDEIAATFAQAKALGVGLIAGATTAGMARRLAPFAEKNGILLAFHNAGGFPDAIASPAALGNALALSKNFRVNLDIGNFTASNNQAVAYLQENYTAISHLTIKDRTRDGGGNEEFGNGDTPIKQVLGLLKQKKYPIPVFVEYEYQGVGTPEEEVGKCLAYVRAALA